MAETPVQPSTALTWQLAPASPRVGLGEQAQTQTRLLSISMVGFLLGFYAMHNQWLQLGWMTACLSTLLASEARSLIWEAWRADRWMQGVAVIFLLGMARSSLLESPGMTLNSFSWGWAGSLFMLLTLGQLWQVGKQPRSPSWMGMTLVLAATLTAVASYTIFSMLSEGSSIGMPLKNWFVYGGWNTVCSGMTFGFASVWASFRWRESASSSARWKYFAWLLATILLIFATLQTLSRGALMALTVAHIAWLLPQRWRAAWKPMAVLLTCMACFQLSAPILSRLAAENLAADLGVATETVKSQSQEFGVIPPNPAMRAVERGDNGRFAIYTAAFSSMTTWQDWLFGKGLWSSNDAWSCSLWWYPEHLHSVFLDAGVRGGVPALLGVLFLTGWGLQRAWKLAREGESLWFVLACFGAVALLFDGDSLFTMLSVPRFEPLVFWTPLVIASARFEASRAASAQRPLS